MINTYDISKDYVMTCYFYIRVSTDLQNCANQRYELDNFATLHHIKADEYIEETISSRKSLSQRKLGKLLKKLQKGDVVITTEISRLGRNMLEVMGILQTCLEKECEIITVKENYHLGADIQSKVLAFAFSLASEIERQLSIVFRLFCNNVGQCFFCSLCL